MHYEYDPYLIQRSNEYWKELQYTSGEFSKETENPKMSLNCYTWPIHHDLLELKVTLIKKLDRMTMVSWTYCRYDQNVVTVTEQIAKIPNEGTAVIMNTRWDQLVNPSAINIYLTVEQEEMNTGYKALGRFKMQQVDCRKNRKMVSIVVNCNTAGQLENW